MSAGIPVFYPTAVAIAIHAAITSDVHGITAAGAAITTAANASAQRTAMGVAYGNTDTTVCVGNDSRLSDARTPVAHKTSHEPGGEDALAVDAAAATGSLRTLGTTSTSACAGNDSRLSDARTPVAHNQAWSTITATPTTISGYGLTDAASTGANTFTGAQLIRAAATQDAIEILARAGGTSSFKATITTLALSASRTWSLPDRSDTFAGLGAQTFTGTQTIGTSSLGGLIVLNRGVDGSGSMKFGWYANDDTYVGVLNGSGAGRVDIGANGGSALIRFGNWDGTAFTPKVTIKPDNGETILGTDPGGSELLRVGGSVNITSGQGYKVAGTKVVGGQASAIADVSTADATDLASAIALANANKSKINTTLAMLRTHGLIAT